MPATKPPCARGKRERETGSESGIEGGGVMRPEQKADLSGEKVEVVQRGVREASL